MRIPLTDQLRAEAERFQLRSACRDCIYHVDRADRCAHEWPDELQKRWPLEGREVGFCKEFELR